MTRSATALLEARNLTKYFGSVVSLRNASLAAYAGEVRCIIGDNGAGKSTLIKILSGYHQPDEGQLFVDGLPIRFDGPSDAIRMGIATVYQDLAIVPTLGIARNFVLGSEPLRGVWPLRRLDFAEADRITREAMRRIGIVLRDTTQRAGTLSGGEQQALAIARAEHFGARVLILDEPTSALGVRESATVLKNISAARERGLAVILITHNVSHALKAGDVFTVLRGGTVSAELRRNEVTEVDLLHHMSGEHSVTMDLET